MLRITFDPAGARVLMGRLIRRSHDTKPLMADISERMVGSVQQNFDQGGRPDKWTPSKRAGGESGGKTLQLSNRLRNSITGRSSRSEARVGTNVKYGRIHHFGGVIKPVKAKALAIPVLPGLKGGPREYDLRYQPAAKGAKREERGLLVRDVETKVGRGKKRRTETRAIVYFVLRGSVKMPARPFMLLQQDDEDYIRRRVLEFMKTGRLS